jgi:hypothetical protein
MTDTIKQDEVIENQDDLHSEEIVKEEIKVDAAEDINAIFSGENLSEEFKANAKAIFEAAVIAKVNEQVNQQVEKLDEEYATKLEEETKAINENIVAKVDEYLEYVVSEWMEENKLSIESGIKAEIVEDFMTGLKNLFVEHYIDIPEEKVDMVEELATKVESLEGELDKAVTENVSLSSQINNYKKETLLAQVSEGLTDVQSAKLKSLAENIEFVSEEDYKEKLNLTKKKYFEESKTQDIAPAKDQFVAEETLDEEFSPVMSHYVKSISRTLRK